MGAIPLTPDTCVRCNQNPPELGRALCKACIQELDHPTPPPPTPTAPRRSGPRMICKPIKGTKP